MIRIPSLAALPLLAGVALPLPALAQSEAGSREFQAAELNELSPQLRQEVLSRATGGNTPRGVLETMLLNSAQQRFPASRIVAVDMGRGVMVLGLPDGTMRGLTFSKQDGLRVVAEITVQR